MRSKQRGFTLVEVLIVVAIAAVLLGMILPNLRGIRESTSETVVIRQIQTIHQAQLQYESLYGSFASTLVELGPPPQGGKPGPQGANLIAGSLASGEKNGYTFTLTRTETGFAVTANPKSRGSSARTFYIDEDGVVHHDSGTPATARSPEIR